jgi:hypothetical protein
MRFYTICWMYWYRLKIKLDYKKNCIRCRGQVFTAPLPSNGLIYLFHCSFSRHMTVWQTNRMEGSLKKLLEKEAGISEHATLLPECWMSMEMRRCWWLGWQHSSCSPTLVSWRSVFLGKTRSEGAPPSWLGTWGVAPNTRQMKQKPVRAASQR